MRVRTDDIRASAHRFLVRIFPNALLGCLCLGAAMARAVAPANDNFFSAQSWGNSPTGTVAGTNVDATVQTGEPAINSGGHSVWYRWVTPLAGTATVHTVNSDFSLILSLFSEAPAGSTGPGNVMLIASTNGSTNTSVSWKSDPGTVFWIAIDGVGGATGTFSLAWQMTSDGRKPDLVPFLYDPNTYNVSQISECEAGHGCGSTNTKRILRFGTLTQNQGESDLYLAAIPNLQFEYHPCHFHYHLVGYADYRLLSNGVPVVNGAKASFCLQDGTRFDTNASPRQRFRCNFQGISRGWGDYYWPALPCQWIDITDVVPGRYTLQVEIDPDGQIPESNETNNFATMEVYVPISPGTHVNEILETALSITNARFEWTGENAAATRHPGEPIIGAGHSVWYRWVAPSNGLMSIDVVGSYFPARLGVFTGNAASNLTAVPNIDPFPTATPAQRVIFQAVSNTSYYVLVDSAQTNVFGVFKLSGWMGRPQNDDFANAMGWDKHVQGVSLRTVNATKEPGEPFHAGNPGGRSVWIPFLADITRAVTVDTEGSSFDTLVAVYTGTSFLDLEEIASNDNAHPSATWSRLVFDAEEDEQYWIVVDGRDGEGGLVNIWINEVDPPTEFLSISVHHGEIEMELIGERDRSYRIEASTNLIHWAPVQSVYKDDATAHIHIPYDTNLTMRFFRAVKLPDND